MAKYEVKAEDIQKYADDVGGKFKNAVKKFQISTAEDGTYFAANKIIYTKFMSKVPSEEKIAYHKKIEDGIPTWRYSDGRWVILIKEKEVEPGTIVTVEKKDGSKEEVKIGSAVGRVSEGTYYKKA